MHNIYDCSNPQNVTEPLSIHLGCGLCNQNNESAELVSYSAWSPDTYVYPHTDIDAGGGSAEVRHRESLWCTSLRLRAQRTMAGTTYVFSWHIIARKTMSNTTGMTKLVSASQESAWRRAEEDTA